MHGEDIDIKPNIKAQQVYDGTFGISVDGFDAPMASGNRDPGSGRAASQHLQIAPASKDDACRYTLYQSPKDIVYTPESALREGHGMVSDFTVFSLGWHSRHKTQVHAIKERVKSINQGSKMRQDVWLHELEE